LPRKYIDNAKETTEREREREIEKDKDK